ncbi:MAG: bifunctional nicotinamidase/pyrazinamidase [Kofleriaceae bacterium]
MRALVLVDLQYDFLPGGALAVPRGDEAIEVARRVMPRFDVVVATQDWHPREHRSFAAQHAGRQIGEVIELAGLPQVLWPVHCVQGTRGAELHEQVRAVTQVFRKGTDPEIDSYSGFFDNGHRKATGLAEWLRERGIDELYVMGLATDYCVKLTVLDARQLGFDVALIEDGCRAVDLAEGDGARAIEAMRAAGARVIRSTDVA